MSQIINELATIEVSNEVLQQLDVGGIYQSFSKSYRELDDLKNFRTEYEKKNKLMRWWHNDKLRDAQLDSAEIQAEFSKTIGQLMMISIMQSKQLSEQQMQLNDQQGNLKTQADGIAEQASKLQEQHQVLAEQSQKLETLVRDYFDLKGLTEDGAQKLIKIASEVKATKDEMLQAFASRAQGVEAVCSAVQSRMESIFEQVDERIRLSEEKILSNIEGVQRNTHEALAIYETNQRTHLESTQNALDQGFEKLLQSQRVVADKIQSKQAAFESRVSDLSNEQDKQLAAHREKLVSIDSAVESLSSQSAELTAAIAATKTELSKSTQRQQNHLDAMAAFQQEASKSLKRFRYFTAIISIIVMGILGAIFYMME